MSIKELSHVGLGGTKDLDLADVDVLKGEDTLSGLGDLLSNKLRDELGNELSGGLVLGLTEDDLSHLLTNLTNLSGLSIGGLLGLVGATLGETNDENTKRVTISGLDISLSLNEGVPLANKRLELVGREGHTGEVGKTLLALDLKDLELELSVGLILRVGLEVTERHLEHTVHERVTGKL